MTAATDYIAQNNVVVEQQENAVFVKSEPKPLREHETSGTTRPSYYVENTPFNRFVIDRPDVLDGYKRIEFVLLNTQQLVIESNTDKFSEATQDFLPEFEKGMAKTITLGSQDDADGLTLQAQVILKRVNYQAYLKDCYPRMNFSQSNFGVRIFTTPSNRICPSGHSIELYYEVALSDKNSGKTLAIADNSLFTQSEIPKVMKRKNQFWNHNIETYYWRSVVDKIENDVSFLVQNIQQKLISTKQTERSNLD